MNWIRLAVAERKIAVLEEKLEEKADYIPHRVAIAMVKGGYKFEGKDTFNLLKD